MQSSKAKQLIKFLIEANLDHQKVKKETKKDDSEDAIKVIFHKNNFSNFLRYRDDLVLPISVEMWPSLSCDAHCPLCTYNINRARKMADKSKELVLADSENYKDLISKFSEAGVCSIIFTGGGEPLLHPEFAELANKAHCSGLDWGLFTHGLHLSTSLVEKLIPAFPRFIRVSINAGDRQAHSKEYRLGDNAYEKIKQNVSKAAKVFNATGNRPIGLGYALSDSCSDENLQGILEYISDVFENSEGGLGFVSFRPKIRYYQDNGLPRLEPKKNKFAFLPDRIAEMIVDPLRKRFGLSLRIDNKHGLFQSVARNKLLGRSIASGWTAQIDHIGRGYFISELNGSPWPNTCYGKFSYFEQFETTWRSSDRLRLLREYESGIHQLPLNSKITHIEKFLQTIRYQIGVFTTSDINEFWKRFEKLELKKPRSWNFL